MQHSIITKYKIMNRIQMVKEYLKEEKINIYRASAPYREMYIYYFTYTTNWLGGY